MDGSTEQALLERLQHHLETHSTDYGRSETRWPVWHYYDPDRYERELARIFQRFPLIAAHLSQLSRPGDFVTQAVGDVAVVVNRTPEGEVRAFLNVCRHRGSRLVTDPCGSRLTKFVCPYHAWTYDADGRLRQVPDRERSFPDVDLDGVGLVPVPVEVRSGFVWVTFRPGHARDGGDPVGIDEHLGALRADLDACGLEGHVVYRQESREYAFNWKLGMEGFLENYHFAVLHKNSTNPIFVHNVDTIDGIGRHVRAVAPKRSLAKVEQGAAGELRPNATILYTIFPNVCLFLEKNHASLLQVVPIGPERSRVELTHVVRYDSLQLRRHWDENIRVFMGAADEDLDMCESIQKGLKSGANEHLLFGRNELGCHLFRDAVESTLVA